MTQHLFLSICAGLQSTSSIRQIAFDHCVPESTVSSVLKSVTFGLPLHLPSTLCIDEFKGSAGEWLSDKKRWDVNKYHTNISCGADGYVIDILPRIDLPYLKDYFLAFSLTERQRVKFFCTDMHGGYLSLARQCFPHADICVDMFHVVKLLNDNVDDARRHLQNHLRDEALYHENMGQSDAMKQNLFLYHMLKNSSRILKTARIHQSEFWKVHKDQNLQRIDACLALSDELKEAYDALQRFHDILHTDPFPLRRAALSDFLDAFCSSAWDGTRRVAGTIRRNRRYIENSWQHGLSNSVSEGLNNKIKVLKRNAFGVHDFDSFRSRILFCCGNVRAVRDCCSIAAERKASSDPSLKDFAWNVNDQATKGEISHD